MAGIKDVVKDFYTVDDALGFDEQTTKDMQHKYLNKTRTILGDCKFFVKAEGARLTDGSGNTHYDFIGAVGVCSVGNNNPFIWEQLEKVYKAKQQMIGVVAYHSLASAFAHNMAVLSPGGKLTKMGTATGGAEAIEAAIKLVKLASRKKEGKTRILSCVNAFHGKTTGAVSVGGKEFWRTYQHPLMETVDWVPFGDAAALEDALKKGEYMAFFVEPIQGEGGIVVPPAGYLPKVRELCDKYGAIMVADEIQCGCGRSGKLWVCDHEGVIPDVLVYAKGFSGGMIPAGGYICKEDVYEAAYGSEETCWHHTATYQENSLGAAAGMATLQFLYENKLIEAAAEKGEYFMGKLREVQSKYPGIIKEVRGMGLMIGLETCAVPDAFKAGYSDYFADPINNELIDTFRVQVMHTINNPAVFRFLPPLTVSLEDIGYVLKSFEQCVKEAYERVNA